ncbi:ESPR domain-containing protein, partial [uncultured Megasphaera sp.]|uniref:ESPR domain-containing protein n=1 Tax=uncultured Megasphaera sp. TaxID=165188 RepID=UPI00262FF718
MNKIFKVIWSKSRNCYVVASELAKGHTKASSTGDKTRRLALAAITALMLLPVGGFSYAADTTTTVEPAATGSTTAVEVYTKEGIDTGMESLQEDIQKFSKEVQNELQANAEAINEEARKRKYSVTNLEKADANEAATREAADNALKQAMTDQKTSTALHISSSGNLIVGTKENQTVRDMKIRGQLTSGSISTGDITSTGDVSVAGKVEAEAVYDDTTKTGNYVVQTNSVGANLSALDTQVKSNADAIEEEARKRKYSVTNLENADKQLQTNIDNEAAAREAKDNELNERITNEANAIHETTNKLQDDLNTETADRKAADAALDSRTTALEDKTEAITYDKDSKTVMVDGKLTATEGFTDGTTKDGKYVKADNYVGQNLNALDQGLQAETAAREAADTTLQTNINNEAAERKAADAALDDKITAEASARVAADTKLVEAVNSGLSLSNDNVLQKNTTTIDAQGNVTTSKTDANEMILNKGNDNQITLNEQGIKVGTNSSVMNANGVYTGGDDYAAAKAAMSADGKIKGANGAFTVDENGNVTSKATITGETVSDGKGASMSNGTVTGKTLTDGIATITNGNINTSGSITGGTVTSTGNISAVGDIHAGGAITGASASIQGALTAGSATITGDLTA